MVTCALCKEEIKPGEEFRQWASGWIAKRSQGGTNALKHMVLHEEFAHPVCVDYTKKHNIGQDSLI